MEIYKPIFLIGVPRSGTTLLNNIICRHKDLAWFSQNDLNLVFTDEYIEF